MSPDSDATSIGLSALKFALDYYGSLYHNKEVSTQRTKATLVFHEKLSLNSGLISERKIWKISRSENYPAGFKYRLVLVNPKTHEVVLLYDNHAPKGAHIHWDDRERMYHYVSLEQLLKDFIQESAVEEKRYYDHKKNRD